MVILPSTSLQEGTVFVDRLRREVANHEFRIGRDEPIRMTVSAGVSCYPHAQVPSKETLDRLADEALYAAKAAGRNCVMRFDALDPAAPERA